MDCLKLGFDDGGVGADLIDLGQRERVFRPAGVMPEDR
jgi:hypothetical protein